MTASKVSETIIRTEVEEKNCCLAHKWAWITVLACAALALMVSGGLLYHYSVFNHIICYSIIGAGVAIGLAATIIALVLASSTSATIKEPSPNSEPNSANPKNPDPEKPIVHTITPNKPEEQKKETILEDPKSYTYYKENLALLEKEIKDWDLAAYEKIVSDIMKDSACSQKMLFLMCQDEKFCQSKAMLGAMSAKWERVYDIDISDVAQSVCRHPSFTSTPSALTLIYNIYFGNKPKNGLTLKELFLSLINAFDYAFTNQLLKTGELNIEELFKELKDKEPFILVRMIRGLDQQQFDQFFLLAVKDPEPNNCLDLCIKTTLFTTSVPARNWVCEKHGLAEQQDYSSFISHILIHACVHNFDVKEGMMKEVINEYILHHSSIHLEPLFNNFLTWTDAQKDSLKEILGLGVLGCSISKQFKKEKGAIWELSDEEEKMVTWLCNPTNKDLQEERPILQLLVSINTRQLAWVVAELKPAKNSELEASHFKKLVLSLLNNGLKVDNLVAAILEPPELMAPPQFLLERLSSTDTRAMSAFYGWFKELTYKEANWNKVPPSFKQEFRSYVMTSCMGIRTFGENDKNVFQIIFYIIPGDCAYFLRDWGQMDPNSLKGLLELFGSKKGAVLKAMCEDEMQNNEEFLAGDCLLVLDQVNLDYFKFVPPYLKNYSILIEGCDPATKDELDKSYIKAIKQQLMVATNLEKYNIKNLQAQRPIFRTLLDNVISIVKKLPHLKNGIAESCREYKEKIIDLDLKMKSLFLTEDNYQYFHSKCMKIVNTLE